MPAPRNDLEARVELKISRSLGVVGRLPRGRPARLWLKLSEHLRERAPLQEFTGRWEMAGFLAFGEMSGSALCLKRIENAVSVSPPRARLEDHVRGRGQRIV